MAAAKGDFFGFPLLPRFFRSVPAFANRFPAGKRSGVKTEPSAASGISAKPLRVFLYATAMITGGAIMIVEILGAKLLAPYFGTSHFVWTAQITITLLALAAGYAVGGWRADRSQRLRWIYGAILLAAVWLGLVTWQLERIAFVCLRGELALGSLAASALLFFVPLAALAMVGPFFVRVLTRDLKAVGGSVGRLTALSTLGSVLGCLLIGYVLIPRLPNSTTLFLTSVLLAAVGTAYFAVWERRALLGAGGAALAGLLPGLWGATHPPLAIHPPAREVYRANSSFGLLQVVDLSEDYRIYLNDLLAQNTINPRTGQSESLFTHLLYGLARGYAPAARDVLAIGLGVGIVPMQFAREGARVDVVEINPAVLPVAERFFGFDPNAVHVILGDGRFVAATTTNRYDVIVLDAFLGESPPSHLMTREAFTALRRCLRPDGVLVMNAFGDFAPGRDFLIGSLRKTLRAVFRSVRLHASGNGNVFLVASDRPELKLTGALDTRHIPPRLRGQARAAWAGAPHLRPEAGIVLTDDFNPADFRDALNREQLRRQLALSLERL